MNSSIFLVGIVIVFITIFIYFIKNFHDIKGYLGEIKEKYKENKFVKIFCVVIILIIIILCGFKIYAQIKLIIRDVRFYKVAKENDEMLEEFDRKYLDEKKYYKEVIINEYNNQKYSEPYIPNGFSYVEGTWESGFVIQDDKQNQYVWVPCTNKENINCEILQRNNFAEEPLISTDICTNENYKVFLQSALENGGFYVSRFEIGKENNEPVSKKGVEIWNNVTRDEANEIVGKMYENLNCELINGYAYDTTLSWIINTNNVVKEVLKIEDKEYMFTGKRSYNNIYDFTDNIMEMTSETSYSNVIIRGYIGVETTGVNGNVLEEMKKESGNFERLSIDKEENSFIAKTILGFRTIIYK